MTNQLDVELQHPARRHKLTERFVRCRSAYVRPDQA